MMTTEILTYGLYGAYGGICYTLMNHYVYKKRYTISPFKKNIYGITITFFVTSFCSWVGIKNATLALIAIIAGIYSAEIKDFLSSNQYPQETKETTKQQKDQ